MSAAWQLRSQSSSVIPCAGPARLGWTAADRSSTIKAHTSFLRRLGAVIRDEVFRSTVVGVMQLDQQQVAQGVRHTTRIPWNQRARWVTSMGIADVVVGLRNACSSAAPTTLGPLVGVCSCCGTRLAMSSMQPANPSTCRCTSHLRFSYLAGCLSADEVGRGQVHSPCGTWYTIVRLADVVHSHQALVGLLRSFGQSQSGSTVECAARLAQTLHPRSLDDARGTGFSTGGFGQASSALGPIPVVEVKLSVDGAAVLGNGRQVTTTSFVVLAAAGTGQSVRDHHVVVSAASDSLCCAPGCAYCALLASSLTGTPRRW